MHDALEFIKLQSDTIMKMLTHSILTYLTDGFKDWRVDWLTKEHHKLVERFIAYKERTEERLKRMQEME